MFGLHRSERGNVQREQIHYESLFQVLLGVAVSWCFVHLAICLGEAVCADFLAGTTVEHSETRSGRRGQKVALFARNTKPEHIPAIGVSTRDGDRKLVPSLQGTVYYGYQILGYERAHLFARVCAGWHASDTVYHEAIAKRWQLDG